MYGKHLNIILTEMFRRVGEEYSIDKTKGDNWYSAHTWTQEEEGEFIKWLSNYLYENREARIEIMEYPIKAKSKCLLVATYFNMNYGWKTIHK